jgi:hypothetical protein
MIRTGAPGKSADEIARQYVNEFKEVPQITGIVHMFHSYYESSDSGFGRILTAA